MSNKMIYYIKTKKSFNELVFVTSKKLFFLYCCHTNSSEIRQEIKFNKHTIYMHNSINKKVNIQLTKKARAFK